MDPVILSQLLESIFADLPNDDLFITFNKTRDANSKIPVRIFTKQNLVNYIVAETLRQVPEGQTITGEAVRNALQGLDPADQLSAQYIQRIAENIDLTDFLTRLNTRTEGNGIDYAVINDPPDIPDPTPPPHHDDATPDGVVTVRDNVGGVSRTVNFFVNFPVVITLNHSVGNTFQLQMPDGYKLVRDGLEGWNQDEAINGVTTYTLGPLAARESGESATWRRAPIAIAA